MRRFARNSHRFLDLPGFPEFLGLLGAAGVTGAEARRHLCVVAAALGDAFALAIRMPSAYARPSLSFEGETEMSKGERHGNRETKKPKKEKIKASAAAPSQKIASGQVSFSPGKKK